MMKDSIGVIGCGKMGGIILDGIVKSGQFESIYAVDPNESIVRAIKEKHGHVITNCTPDQLFHKCSFVLVCVKPNMVASVLSPIASASASTATGVVVSIAAGISTKQLKSLVSNSPAGRFIRVMPNTPLQVGAGYSTIFCDDPSVSEEAIDKVIRLFQTMGKTHRLHSESLMDVATALAGSGPGLILLLLEALSDGALLNGLPKELSIEMAAQTMLGTAKMVLEGNAGKHVAQLRDEVCTPGGCTIAGIASLEEDAVRGALIKSISEVCQAARRSLN